MPSRRLPMSVCRQPNSSPLLTTMVAGLLCTGTLVLALGASPGDQGGGKNPTVTVGGIQVAKVTAPKDETMSRPFNSENGTKLVLCIQMPAGKGRTWTYQDNAELERVADAKRTHL